MNPTEIMRSASNALLDAAEVERLKLVGFSVTIVDTDLILVIEVPDSLPRMKAGARKAIPMGLVIGAFDVHKFIRREARDLCRRLNERVS